MLQRVSQKIRQVGLVRTFGLATKYLGGLLSDISVLAQNEINSYKNYDLSIRARIYAWRHGFISRSHVWLNLNSKNADDYISNYDYIRYICGINDGYQDVLENKLLFKRSTSVHSDHLEPLIGTIFNGDYINRASASDTDFFSDVADSDHVVLKPMRGVGGSGIHIVEQDSEGYTLDDRRVTKDEIDDLIESLDSYIVSEFVEQLDYARDIYPGSLNTIRVLTVIGPETNRAEIVRAVHRFGTRDSEPVDNWSQGGVCAPIDIETGELQRLVVHRTPTGRETLHYHPGTKTEVSGKTVPQWDDITDIITDIAEYYSGAPYVGWDIVPTEGGPVIIEANARPGINIVQLESGLYTEDAVRRLFDQYTIVGMS